VGQYSTVSLPRVLFAYILHIGLVVFSIILYIFLVYRVQVPNCDASQVTKACNSLGYLDEMILGKEHMLWNFTNSTSPAPITPYFDPEGLVATSGCVSTVFVGMMVGRFWSLTHFPMLDTFLLGSVLVIVGVCWRKMI
jgi:predicted acyltransferase